MHLTTCSLLSIFSTLIALSVASPLENPLEARAAKSTTSHTSTASPTSKSLSTTDLTASSSVAPASATQGSGNFVVFYNQPADNSDTVSVTIEDTIQATLDPKGFET